MKNEIAVYQNHTLRDIQKLKNDEVERGVLNAFRNHVAMSLSLSGQTSLDRLKHATNDLINDFPGITMQDLKKIIDKYVAGDFQTAPMSNFFDKILLHKIINEYRTWKRLQNKTHPATEAPTEAEKERIMLDAVDRVKKEIQETGDLEGTAHHVYDFLIKTGRLERPTTGVSEKYIAQAKEITRKHIQKKLDNATDLAGRRLFQNTLKMFEKTGTIQKNLAKTLFIIDHFKKTSS